MDSSTLKADFEFETFSLAWSEYIIFGATLTASLGIGAYYGFYGGKNQTNEDFLMAGRSMSVLPVTVSMICSFVSAITLLGNPVEVYFYGTQYTMVALTFIPMTLALAYLYVPVFFELQLTSAYEYFEWRFNSKVRFTVSNFAVINSLFYMPNTIWGPSLALQQAAGINAKLSAAIIFLVCIAYSSIGGLKAVLWTDVLQGVVMVGSMLAIMCCGIIEAGGIHYIWEANVATGRVQWFNFDPDPRTRHTFWTSLVGGLFLWLPTFAATQAQIQRYNSVPSLRAVRKCLFFNMFGLMTVICLCQISDKFLI